MGCNSSQFNANETMDGFYKVAVCSTIKPGAFKRSYSNRNGSATSSGTGNAASPPKKKRNILRRCLPKLRNMHLNDFVKEREEHSLQQQDISCGYFSASMETSSSCSTPTNDTYLPPSVDSSSSSSELGKVSHSSGYCSNESSTSSINDFNCYGDLQLEMYMLARFPAQMPKTSSPIVERRGDAAAPMVKTRPTVTYQKWRNHLQTMPDSVPLNVTDIPEAIAGQFSPFDFPGYTDLRQEMWECNAAKRFKSNVSATGIISTDL